MPLLQLILLALIQGITEFLPVSSSAHLILAPWVVDGWADQGPLIDIAAHVGSLMAVLLYFRAETASLFRGGIDTVTFKASDDRRLFLFIAGATVPVIAMAGVFVVMDWTDAVRSPFVIGWTSIIFGIVLYIADRRLNHMYGLENLNWPRAMIIGLSQALAIIPGVSRSGITMTAARFLGFTREESARFSMLLAIPTILAFGLYAGVEIVQDGAGASPSDALIMAVLSFAAAYGTIHVFMQLTRRISFTPFVLYRVLLGIGLLIFAYNVS